MVLRRILSSIAALAAVILASAFALAEPQTFNPEIFRTRREAVTRRMGTEPLLMLGARAPGAYSQFRQSNDFFYLTGVTESNAALLMIPKEKREILFLDPGDPAMLRWDGPRMLPGPEASKLTGIREIRRRDELVDFLDRLFAGRDAKALNMPLWPEEIGTSIFDASYPALETQRDDPLDGGLWREERTKARLVERFKGISVTDASPAIRALREVKGPEEIAALRMAARITALGFEAAFKACRPGAWEYELEGAMAGACKTAGGQAWAYNPICGSGPNANIMHYANNDRRMQENDIVLLDAGFSWNYYAMDVTRSFPVSGKFSDRHRKVYQDLLKVQLDALSRVKPGVSLVDLHNRVNRELKSMGYGDNLVHFLGHYMGMAVHDPGDFSRPLRPGNVITIEPGVYFEDEGFGMRIEDTVLVTPDGCENFSAMIPKTVEEIEAAMKK